MNYFELFEIPVALHVDLAQLKQQFYLLSRKYHPDFYTRENDAAQADSLEMSSQVNKAYKVFQNQQATIQYVLQQKELLEEEEKYQLPADFLMEMLELNEQLAEAKMDNDRKSIDEVTKKIATAEAAIYAPVKTIVEGYKDGHTTNEDLLKVKGYYFKKKYLERILAAM